MSATADPTVETTDSGDAGVAEYLESGRKPWWRRNLKWWLPALIVVGIIAAMTLFKPEEQGPEYITQEVERRELDLTVTATGNLRPTNQVEVGSEVSGRIDRILVDVNDRVGRGQVLAYINTDVIEDQIAQARANVEAQRAQVTQALAALNGDRAQVVQARATLDVDQAQLARLRSVYQASGGKVPSQVELEQAQAAVARDRAAVAAAEAAVARSEAAVAAARSGVEAQQATLSTSLTQRNRAVIRSPVSGVVLARQVEPGQTVAASFNTPTLFVIAEDLGAMQLRVDVDEADVGQVEPGQKATFTVDSYPGRQFPATVERVDLASSNTAAQAGGAAAAAGGQSVVNYEARLTVANTDNLLRPGMTATATIATRSTGLRLLVPNGALRFDPDEEEEGEGSVLNPNFGLEEKEQQANIGSGSRQAVHVLQADGTLRRIEVVTGQSDGARTVVTSADLKPGMKVVTGKKAGQGA